MLELTGREVCADVLKSCVTKATTRALRERAQLGMHSILPGMHSILQYYLASHGVPNPWSQAPPPGLGIVPNSWSEFFSDDDSDSESSHSSDY